MNEVDRVEVDAFGAAAIRNEMQRIRALFVKSADDAEDLITYAKEIVRLRTALQGADTVTEAMIDRTAWLIEMESDCRSRGSTAYFGAHYWNPTLGFHDDIDQALQFARKQDAEAFKREFKITSGRVAEHMWPRAAAPTAQDDTGARLDTDWKQLQDDLAESRGEQSPVDGPRE